MRPLGILDVSGVIEDTVELAPLADRLGYERYWIAEHQPQPSPVLITAIVAGLTERIRVGTAGVLLHYHPPRRTAHDLLFVERLYGGRIDAGFVGGIVRDPKMLDDLEGREPGAVYRAYPERVATFVRHLRNTLDNEAIDEAVTWGGTPEHAPQIWSHGTGTRSAELAAVNGLSFGFGLLFPNSAEDPEVIAHYRSRFVPARPGDEPRTVLAVAGVVAETDAAAEEMKRTAGFKTFAAGSGATVARALTELADRHAVDEVVFADLHDGLDARKRCYELLWDAWQKGG